MTRDLLLAAAPILCFTGLAALPTSPRSSFFLTVATVFCLFAAYLIEPITLP